jgi:hypothetical protein
MWDLLFCHGRNHYVVKGTNPKTSIFVDFDPNNKPDFVLDIRMIKFKECHIFDRVFMMFCYKNTTIIELPHFIPSVYNVLKKDGLLLLPSGMFDFEWTRKTFNKIIKPYFYITPVGKYSPDDKNTLIMFKRRSKILKVKL